MDSKLIQRTISTTLRSHIKAPAQHYLIHIYANKYKNLNLSLASVEEFPKISLCKNTQ